MNAQRYLYEKKLFQTICKIIRSEKKTDTLYYIILSYYEDSDTSEKLILM
jgi:hypothetical protein